MAYAFGNTTRVTGTFALQEGHAATQGHLVATPFGDPHRDRLLDLWFTNKSGTVRGYAIDMTKRLHLIAISDDFRSFAHVHPLLDRVGHFHLGMRFAKSGSWHLFADAHPIGIGHQVFRFDLALDYTKSEARAITPTGTQVLAGPYLVRLQTTDLRAGADNALTIHITEQGHAAHDLHPYLGALAHAVFINARTLTYAHVHPMPLERRATVAQGVRRTDMPGITGMGNMDAMPALPEGKASSPDMLLHVAVREAGTYKMWLQFRGARGALYVAPFVIFVH